MGYFPQTLYKWDRPRFPAIPLGSSHHLPFFSFPRSAWECRDSYAERRNQINYAAHACLNGLFSTDSLQMGQAKISSNSFGIISSPPFFLIPTLCVGMQGFLRGA